jgi:predicted DNA-binding transcriptional regulator AlpA
MQSATTETYEQKRERLRITAERRLADKLKRWDALPDAAHVDVRTVSAILGCSPPTTWRRARAGQIPAPVKLGPQSTRWVVGAVRKHLREMQASAAGVGA